MRFDRAQGFSSRTVSQLFKELGETPLVLKPGIRLHTG